MNKQSLAPPDHPSGEHVAVDPGREDGPVAVDTFGGRVHVEWDPQAPVTRWVSFRFLSSVCAWAVCWIRGWPTDIATGWTECVLRADD